LSFVTATKVSTRNLSGFPDPQQLRRLMQSMAMLDALLEEAWDRRYYSFQADWAPSEQMGSMLPR
jgi:hypothetical protein